MDEPTGYQGFGGFVLLHLTLAIMALVGIGLSDASMGKKALWCAIVLLFPCIGVIAYFIVGRRMLDE